MAQTRDVRAGTAQRLRSGPLPVVDGWALVRLLGQGQWTCVYQARPAELPEDQPADYALKLVRPDCADPNAGLAQLGREAEVGRQVAHPHLVSILAACLDATPPYVVMPYLEGATLARRTGSGRPLPQILWLVRQTAEALHALHREGWLHGDVKPTNILVSAQGHVTLIDLGFARPVDHQRMRFEPTLAGTLNYAAPELFVCNRACDGQADVYSLGVVLFELLTGRLPFCEEDPTELALAHLRRPAPDPRRFLPTLPLRAARLTHRMLAKEPLRRPRADELVEQLLDLEVEHFDQWSLAEPSVFA